MGQKGFLSVQRHNYCSNLYVVTYFKAKQAIPRFHGSKEHTTDHLGTVNSNPPQICVLVCVDWLLNVTINDISVIHVTAHRCAGRLKKKLYLGSASHAMDISYGSLKYSDKLTGDWCSPIFVKAQYTVILTIKAPWTPLPLRFGAYSDRSIVLSHSITRWFVHSATSAGIFCSWPWNKHTISQLSLYIGD